MIALKIHLVGDGAWPDLGESGKYVNATNMEVALLRGGMKSGKHSVSIRSNLPDGTAVIAQISLDLWITASKAFSARVEMEGEET